MLFALGTCCPSARWQGNEERKRGHDLGRPELVWQRQNPMSFLKESMSASVQRPERSLHTPSFRVFSVTAARAVGVRFQPGGSDLLRRYPAVALDGPRSPWTGLLHLADGARTERLLAP